MDSLSDLRYSIPPTPAWSPASTISPERALIPTADAALGRRQEEPTGNLTINANGDLVTPLGNVFPPPPADYVAVYCDTSGNIAGTYPSSANLLIQGNTVYGSNAAFSCDASISGDMIYLNKNLERIALGVPKDIATSTTQTRQSTTTRVTSTLAQASAIPNLPNTNQSVRVYGDGIVQNSDGSVSIDNDGYTVPDNTAVLRVQNGAISGFATTLQGTLQLDPNNKTISYYQGGGTNETFDASTASGPLPLLDKTLKVLDYLVPETQTQVFTDAYTTVVPTAIHSSNITRGDLRSASGQDHGHPSVGKKVGEGLGYTVLGLIVLYGSVRCVVGRAKDDGIPGSGR
jgi:hypothetical protein